MIQQFTTIKKIMVCSSLCNSFFFLPDPAHLRQIKKKKRVWWLVAVMGLVASLWHAPCSHFVCVVCAPRFFLTSRCPTGNNILFCAFLTIIFFRRILRLERLEAQKGAPRESQSLRPKYCPSPTHSAGPRKKIWCPSSRATIRIFLAKSAKKTTTYQRSGGG